MDLLPDLDARGLVHDATDRDALARRLARGGIGVYVGFDPTADSLHVGHLVGQITLRRFQLAGHRPFPLAGGATGMVGDPGGRSEERNLLDRETLQHNVSCIKRQLERLLDFDGRFAATLVDNADWTEPLGTLDFLRDVGKHVTVNQMLGKESVRSRVESEHGISFTEFSYMLLQANDFRHLCEHHDVELQMGGSDQWGNITLGIDFIRRRLGRSAHGLTWPLVTRSDGEKMGKSVGGAVWLDADRTSPYQFRQFWIQLPDADIESFLLRYSMRSIEEVGALVADHEADPGRRLAQRALAHELTALVHGQEAADAAAAAAEVLFGGDASEASAAALEVVRAEVPSSMVRSGELDDLVSLLDRAGVAGSKGEARRLLAQNAIRVNGQRAREDTTIADVTPLHGRYLLLGRGRSTYHLVEIVP